MCQSQARTSLAVKFSHHGSWKLLPSVGKAQHRMSNWSTPTTVAAAEGDPAAAVMAPFTGKGHFSSEPAALTCEEQGGIANFA